jgi:uncharacterized membrane protein YvbJ
MPDNAVFCTNCGARFQNTQPAAKPKSKTPLFIGIGAAAVVFLAVLIFLLTKVFGGGTNSSAEGVVKTFFKAVSTQDVKLLQKTLYFEDEDDREAFEDDDEIEDAEESLDYANEMFEEELGKNWVDELEIEEGKTKKIDGNTVVIVEVTVEVDDDEETLEINVIKEDGKYYVDPISLASMF